MAARYNSYGSRSSTASSAQSDPSSSAEFKKSSFQNKPNSSSSSSSRVIVNSKPSDLSKTKTYKAENQGNLSAMMKKFMEMKKTNPKRMELVIPSDVIAAELKKTDKGKGGNGFGALQRKLFGKSEKEKKETKALVEVKGNTRTLAMVLRSERELLSMNKEQGVEISQLKLQLEQRNREVEKLKDLCLKQREEIKELKSAILFPDVMNSQLQELVEKQSCELKQARQVIPTLQRQVTSLTGQLQFLAEDLAEVKADKKSAQKCFPQHVNSQERSSTFDHGLSSDSLDFSSEHSGNLDDPDDLFLEDLNPCLTPYSKAKSKDFVGRCYKSPEESFSANSTVTVEEFGFGSSSKKLSKSSECCVQSKTRKTVNRGGRRSHESKFSYRRSNDSGMMV